MTYSLSTLFHFIPRTHRTTLFYEATAFCLKFCFDMGNVTLMFVVFLATVTVSTAIHCYQCSSSQDPKGQDNCGAYEKFDTERNSPVECSSGESHMPGSFCVKVTKQGPIGFVWDGRWRQVTRRCASISNSGVTGVCNWGVDYNGVYWEECYCSGDACNSATDLKASSIFTYSMIFLTIPYLNKWSRYD